MAGGIKIGPYKPLGVSTQAVPGGGYINVDASAGNFSPSPWLQLGLQAASGAASIAGVAAEQLAGDNEAAVKRADVQLGETEQALLFDPQTGYLNLQGQDAVTQAPTVLDTYAKAQDGVMATMVDDDQRRTFGGIADSRSAAFADLVNQHADAQRQIAYDQASDRRIELMQVDAGLHWNDDTLLRRSLGTTRAEVRDQAERKGWDAARTKAAVHHYTSRALTSAIEAAVEHDPDRAQALRKRYAAALEHHHAVALDALLAEAQVRQQAAAESAEILNAAPPDGAQPTQHWRLQQADAIADPAMRAATVHHLLSAAAAAELRARTLAEQVLARVLKDDLTDSLQIPLREWVALDAERRRAIETRLDHNAAGTEPGPNPALVDQLATQATQTPSVFAHRDLVPQIAHLPLPQWQRFRDWQAGLRRNDPATEDELYAIRRGFQIARSLLPQETVRPGEERSPSATDVPLRSALVEEIDTARKLTGKSPDDAALREMVRRNLPDASSSNISFSSVGNSEVLRRLLDVRVASPYGSPEAPLRFFGLPFRSPYGNLPGFGRLPGFPGQLGDDLLFALSLLYSLYSGGLSGRAARPAPPSAATEPPGQSIDEFNLFMLRLLMGAVFPQLQLDAMVRPAPSISPSEESDDDDESSEPPSDPAKPSTRPSTTPPPPPPPVPPPPASTPGQQSPLGQPRTQVPASRPQRTQSEPWGRDYGKQWSSVSSGRPQVNKGQQAKHDPNHHYFKQGRSEFTHTDPQALMNKFAGTGQPVNNVPRGQAGFRERVDFGEVIGRYNGAPTQRGIIHYAQDGTVHIVPAAP